MRTQKVKNLSSEEFTKLWNELYQDGTKVKYDIKKDTQYRNP